jgi:serine/threonine protein kinase
MGDPKEAFRMLAAPNLEGAGADPLLGTLLHGKFRIQALIARGGMGRIYRAQQEPLGRACAIKVVNAGFGSIDPEFQRRFYLEASVLSKLTHPNTVTVYDYGKTDDDMLYMAMELLEGRTLHRAIREERVFSESRALHVVRQICRALREAHAHGVVHRDLKPANIFLMRHGDENDFVKVLDFGLVKHINEKPDDQLTQTGLFMGSPKYMAPEQIEGELVDARTDLYSIGVLMYEMLTGRVPFERATSVATLMAHVHEPVPSMFELNRNLRPELVAIVLKCLEKKATNRLGSTDELLHALRGLDGAGQSGPFERQSDTKALSSGAPESAVVPPSRPPEREQAVSAVLVRDVPKRTPAPRLISMALLIGSTVVGGGLGLVALRFTRTAPKVVVAGVVPASAVAVPDRQPAGSSAPQQAAPQASVQPTSDVAISVESLPRDSGATRTRERTKGVPRGANSAGLSRSSASSTPSTAPTQSATKPPAGFKDEPY